MQAEAEEQDMTQTTANMPEDAAARRAVEPVICYPNDSLPPPDLELYRAARAGARKTGEVRVAPRDASCFEVPAGGFFRISSVCLLYTSPSPRDLSTSRMPSSA